MSPQKKDCGTYKGTHLKTGEYCLATRFQDGSSRDPWEVGFFFGVSLERYMVTDGAGVAKRPNGYNRCERITQEQGDKLLSSVKELDNSTVSLWDFIK